MRRPEEEQAPPEEEQAPDPASPATPPRGYGLPRAAGAGSGGVEERRAMVEPHRGRSDTPWWSAARHAMGEGGREPAVVEPQRTVGERGRPRGREGRGRGSR